MKNKLYLLALGMSMLAYSFNMLHEYYVSVTNITLNTKANEIQVTLKFTAHDLEKAIHQYTGINVKVDDTRYKQGIDTLVKKYVNDHFKIQTSENQELIYVGFEYQLDETLFVYCAKPFQTKPNSIEVTNSLLVETFPGQENITYVNEADKKQSFSFRSNQLTHTFQLNE